MGNRAAPTWCSLSVYDTSSLMECGGAGLEAPGLSSLPPSAGRIANWWILIGRSSMTVAERREARPVTICPARGVGTAI